MKIDSLLFNLPLNTALLAYFATQSEFGDDIKVIIAIQSLTNLWLYPLIWYFPNVWKWMSGGTPQNGVDSYAFLVLVVKVALVSSFVFLGWVDETRSNLTSIVVVAPATYMAVSATWLQRQVYNKIGKEGVYYGSRLGCVVPWCSDFPFDTLRHPQYLSATSLFFAFLLIIGWRKESATVFVSQLWFYTLSAYMEETE